MVTKSIAVILPHYNDPEGLARSLASVLKQTVLPREVIVVDDCSTERLFEDALQQVEQARRHAGPTAIELISTPQNSGPSASRNRGIEASDSDIFAFLDCGDTWLCRKLELQSELFDTRPEVVFSSHRVAVEGLPERDPRPQSAVSGFDPYEQPSVWSWMFRNRATTTSVMVRSSILPRFDEGMDRSEDFDLWLRVLLKYGPQPVSRQALALKPVSNFLGAGLSADIVGMEKGELRALSNNKAPGVVGTLAFLAASSWSVLKFLRRLILRGVAARFRAAVPQVQRAG